MRKYSFRTYALLMSVCLFILLQCEKTYLPVDSSGKINYLQGNTAARIILQLLDRHTFDPLPSVMVTIIGGDSGMTDSTGIVIFDSIRVGSYLVTCHKSGFESTINNFELTIDSNSNTVPVVNQSTNILYMAKKGVSVKGNVYYEKDGKKTPVDGATIECQLTNTSLAFQKPLVVATSDAGTYSLSDLPEYSTYLIKILPFVSNSITYKQTSAISVGGQAIGETQRAQDIVLTQFVDGNFIVLSHNLETFTKMDSLKFEFSEAVDTAALGPDSIYVTLGGASNRILVNKIWQAGNTKLIIAPFDGKWSASQVYTLVFRKFLSTTGKTLNNTEFSSYSFSSITTGALGNVKNLRCRVGLSDTSKVDYSTSSITLLWSGLANAASYDIYQKSSSDSSWLYYQSVSDTMVSISTSGKFSYGKYMNFLVVGKNSATISPFESAMILTIRDQKKPIINMVSTYSGFNHTTYNYIDTIRISVSSGYLPEPMDTTKKPTVKVKEASYVSGSTLYGDTLYAIDANRCSWIWTSDRSGTMNVAIDPLKNGAYDSLKIDFSRVTDWAGNAADTSAGAGYLYYSTRP
jgi:hypothetical protein